MGKVRPAGDAIPLEQIEQDQPLRDRLKAMKLGDTTELEVASVVGQWERIVDLTRGPVIDGIRPIGTAQDAWSKARKEGRFVDIRPAVPNETHLATFEERLLRWDTPENRIR